MANKRLFVLVSSSLRGDSWTIKMNIKPDLKHTSNTMTTCRWEPDLSHNRSLWVFDINLHSTVSVGGQADRLSVAIRDWVKLRILFTDHSVGNMSPTFQVEHPKQDQNDKSVLHKKQYCNLSNFFIHFLLSVSTT